MGFDIQKMAEGLTARERAKLHIANVHARHDGKDAFNPSELLELLRSPDERFHRECWYFIELYRWPYILWRQEIGRIWLALCPIFQTIEMFRVMPEHKKPLVTYDAGEMAEMAMEQIRQLNEYKSAMDEIEKLGDGLPLFGEWDYDKIRLWVRSANRFREVNNEWVEEFGKDKALLIGDVTPREEYVRTYVKDITYMADLCTNRHVAMGRTKAL